MRVIFMGTPEFAVPCLDAVVQAGHDVVLVVSQPDRPAGRGQQLQSPPVVVRARELGLPVAQPKALKSGPFPERYIGLHADVACVVAYGRILPATLLDAPKHGCINVHASLLPRWRGAAPIQAAVLHGDAISGVCTQRMAEELDTGPIYVSRSLRLDPHETAGTLHDKLSQLGAEALAETLDGLADRVPEPQDHAQATYIGKIDKDSGKVDLADDALAIDRRIRAMTPWPGGWVEHPAGRIKLLAAKPVPGEGAPGELLSTSPLVVACGSGALEIERIQAPGRRAVSGRDFANGARLSVGDSLLEG